MARPIDPFREMERPFREMERLVNGLTTRATGTASMPMNLYREGDAFVAEVELPGVDPASIDVDVEERTLTVRAERREQTAKEGRQWLTRERAAGTRIIAETEHFTVFVPAAAKWPLEAMVMPNEEVPDFAALSGAQRADLAPLLKKLYSAVDRFFDGVDKTPYIAGWTQAPVDKALRPGIRMHLQLFSLMRSPGRMKYLAGSESSQAVWINDTTPERIAARFKEIWDA